MSNMPKSKNDRALAAANKAMAKLSPQQIEAMTVGNAKGFEDQLKVATEEWDNAFIAVGESIAKIAVIALAATEQPETQELILKMAEQAIGMNDVVHNFTKVQIPAVPRIGYFKGVVHNLNAFLKAGGPMIRQNLNNHAAAMRKMADVSDLVTGVEEHTDDDPAEVQAAAALTPEQAKVADEVAAKILDVIGGEQ